MPTPFNHIVLAERVLTDPDLPDPIRGQLESHRPAFLLGNTAPDLGSVSALGRSETHFFTVPMTDRSPAHLRLLARHPQLSDPDRLDPSQAAFLAGYLAHLWLDQLWILSIFEPLFGPTAPGGSFHQRLVAHNLLRAHLDREDRSRLPDGLGGLLRQAHPHSWLPFAADEHIGRWRDHLAIQLAPGGNSITTQVFARRLRIATRRFAHMLDAPKEMERLVFRRLPAGLVESYWNLGLAQSVELVQYYYRGHAARAPITGRKVPRVLDTLGAPTGEYHESHREV